MWFILMMISFAEYVNTKESAFIVVSGLCVIASAIHRLCNVIEKASAIHITFDENKSIEGDKTNENVER